MKLRRMINNGTNFQGQKEPGKLARANGYHPSRKAKIRAGKILGRKNCRK